MAAGNSSITHDITDSNSLGVAVRGLLAASTAAWNAGDLAAFLGCYDESPDTVYFGAAGCVLGSAAIAQMYAGRFASAGLAALGTLTTSVLHVVALGTRHALACGRYVLERGAAGRAQGTFSLVFVATAAGWRITADHTGA